MVGLGHLKGMTRRFGAWNRLVEIRVAGYPEGNTPFQIVAYSFAIRQDRVPRNVLMTSSIDGLRFHAAVECP